MMDKKKIVEIIEKHIETGIEGEPGHEHSIVAGIDEAAAEIMAEIERKEPKKKSKELTFPECIKILLDDTATEDMNGLEAIWEEEFKELRSEIVKMVLDWLPSVTEFETVLLTLFPNSKLLDNIRPVAVAMQETVIKKMDLEENEKAKV